MEIVKPGKTQKTSERWKSQYLRSDGWGTTYGKHGPKSAQTIYDKLVLVEQSKSARNKLDKIDEIIGNKSWTHSHCSSCSTFSRETLVSIDVSGGEYSCQLCITCVKKMLDLLERAK